MWLTSQVVIASCGSHTIFIIGFGARAISFVCLFFCVYASVCCCETVEKRRERERERENAREREREGARACVRNKMKIEEVQSTTKKQRVASHTHIKGLGLKVLSLSLSLSRFHFLLNGKDSGRVCGVQNSLKI